MTVNKVALLIYGESNSGRNALTEEKYKDLAIEFSSQGFDVRSILYNDESTDKLAKELLQFDAVLVWVNPIEQGKDRKKLDSLLVEVSGKGCFVSTHPDVILKMGTKEVLYKTKDIEWSSNVKMYASYEDFLRRFPDSLRSSGKRILKQYRGNGGNGVFKVMQTGSANEVMVIHAKEGAEKRKLSWKGFNHEFQSFFLNDGMLIDQEWNKNMVNGMVRCYVSGTKVAGFGYQEINALYESNGETYLPPSKRYYFTEHCGLFSDLKEIMESKWVPQLMNSLSIPWNMMPVIWDADFFINEANSLNVVGKYSLCEINVSCVSPFPPSAIRFIVDEVKRRIKK